MNTLEFREDSREIPPVRTPWKVLVVDDADEVRMLTRLTLDGFTYEGRGVDLLEAASADQAKRLLLENDDIAVAVVDVVMETEHAGLDLVRWIRKERHNLLIRLLVRTGQSGLYPAASVIAEYEINDYWEKTELTFSRFRTSLTTSLRGYADLLSMHRRTLQIRQWADRFPDLLGVRDWNTLLRLVMLRLRELFPEATLSAFLCRNDGRRWPLISGTGTYPMHGAPDVKEHLDEARAALLLDAWDRKTFAETGDAQALYFEVSSGEGHLFLLELPPEWEQYERNVTRLVLQNFRAALENRTLITDLERHKNDMVTLLRQQEDSARDVHNRFQNSLQVVLSFIDIESRDRTGVSGRSPLAGVQRRLHGLSLLHALLHSEQRLSGVNFQTYLQALVDHDRTYLTRLSDRGIEYWGVPVEVPLEVAVPLALAALEMIDLVQAPCFRIEGMGQVQVVLSDSPLRLSVGRVGVVFREFPDPVPLEWQLVGTLASQLGGRAWVEEGCLRFEWSKASP